MHYCFRRIAPFLFFFGLFSCIGYGQTGTLSIAVSSTQGFARVDGHLLNLAEDSTIDLPAGTYTVETWAPYFAVHRDEVVVRAGETTDYVRGLVTKSPEYRGCLDARSEFATRKLHRTASDLTLVAAYGILGYFSVGKNSGTAQRAYDRALSLHELHRVSVNPAGITGSARAYTARSEDYAGARTARNRQLRIGIPVMAGATAALAYHLIRRAAHRPTRPECGTQNPFTAVHLSPTTNGLGLTANF